jgi:prophage regulatory protein
MQRHELPTTSVEPRVHGALREKDVLQKVGISKSQLWRLIKRGDFPKPIKISERCNAWSARRIDAWLSEKFGGAA